MVFVSLGKRTPIWLLIIKGNLIESSCYSDDNYTLEENEGTHIM
jgi:hypothetical protein